MQISLINTSDSALENNTVSLTVHTVLRICGIFAPTTVLMLTLLNIRPVLKMCFDRCSFCGLNIGFS
jgi:hypothetical protein